MRALGVLPIRAAGHPTGAIPEAIDETGLARDLSAACCEARKAVGDVGLGLSREAV